MTGRFFSQWALVVRCVLLAAFHGGAAHADRFHDFRRADTDGTGGKFEDILRTQNAGPNDCKYPASEVPEYRNVASGLGITADHAIRLTGSAKDTMEVDSIKAGKTEKVPDASTKEQAALEILAQVSAKDWDKAVAELKGKIADLNRRIAQVTTTTDKTMSQQLEALRYLAEIAELVGPLANGSATGITKEGQRLYARFRALVPNPTKQTSSFFAPGATL